MNYKEVWESIGRFFYTANFSILVSGLIVWDTNLLDLIPCMIHLEPHSFLIFLSVLLLLVYYIIDWLDANLVSSIDSEVKLKDIVFWLLAPIFLSFTLALLLKKGIGNDTSCWSYLGINLYLLFNALILFFREGLIDKKLLEDLWVGNRPKAYNKTHNVKTLEIILGVVNLGLFIAANANLFFQSKKDVRLLIKEHESMILIVFVAIILLNLIMKWFRHNNVNLIYYNISKEQPGKENMEK